MLATATGMFTQPAAWLTPVAERPLQLQPTTDAQPQPQSAVRDVPTAAEILEQVTNITAPRRGTKRVADGSAKRAARRTWTQHVADLLVSTLKYVNASVLGICL